MHNEGENPADLENLASWVLKKLAGDDYNFTLTGEGGRWELTMWQWEKDFEQALKPEEVERHASVLLDPDFLRLFEKSGGIETDEDVQRLLAPDLLGRHLKDMRLHLGPEKQSDGESYLYEKYPKGMRNAVTSAFLRELGEMLPKLISRIDQLRSLPADETVPKDVQIYLKEASECFIYGRFISCLIVCRSAIEFALRDRLKLEDTLEKLISYGRDKHWILRPTLDLADDVRIAANRGVHDSVPTAEVCKEMFDKTRGVLKELYSEQDPLGPLGSALTN